MRNAGSPEFAVQGYTAVVNGQRIRETTLREYLSRWEAVDTFKAQELAAMTEERALEIIRSLRLFASAPENPLNGMGLVEQQKIFHRHQE